MSMRKSLLIIGAAGLLLTGAAIVLLIAERNSPGTPESESANRSGNTETGIPDLWSGFGQTAEPPPGLLPEGTQEGDAPPSSPVDLTTLRDSMPDNLYWKMLAPTRDPQVLETRAREKAKWNKEYGRVLSNTATPAEIRAYYAYKRKLSEDYIRFLVRLRETYGDDLTEHQAGLIDLGIELHTARIQQSPRDVQIALERRTAYEVKKAAYKKQQ